LQSYYYLCSPEFISGSISFIVKKSTHLSIAYMLQKEVIVFMGRDEKEDIILFLKIIDVNPMRNFFIY